MAGEDKPELWRERIEHARRIQEEMRAYRDANPVEIVRYRPLRVRWPS